MTKKYEPKVPLALIHEPREAIKREASIHDTV